MVVVIILILFSQMFCMPGFIRSVRDDGVYRKSKAFDFNRIFLLDVFGLAAICFGLGTGGFWKLADYLWEDKVAVVCLVYAVVNIIVQCFLLKKEGAEAELAKCRYSKAVWLAGTVVHAVLMAVAVSNVRDAHVWMLGVGITYGIYNFGFLCFIYFKAKELLETTCQAGQEELPGNVVDTNAIADMELEPLQEVDCERYRQERAIKMEGEIQVAMLIFCMISVTLLIALQFILQKCSVEVVLWACGFTIVMVVFGTGIFLGYRMKKKKEIKRMQFYKVCEGRGRMVSLNPLTVQYRKPNGTMTVEQVFMKKNKSVSLGAVVNIVVENEKNIRILTEDKAIVKITSRDEAIFSMRPTEEKNLVPIHKVDCEEYRKRRLKEIGKNSLIQLLQSSLISGVFATVLLLLVGYGSATYYWLMLPLLVVIYGMRGIFFWRRTSEHWRTLQLDEVCEGHARIISGNPLVVRYRRLDGTMEEKQAFLQIQKMVPAGTMVRIVLENGKVAKIATEDGKRIADVPIVEVTEETMREGKKESRKMALILLVMVIVFMAITTLLLFL